MSNKATEPDEIVPISSRLPKSTWTAMKREAVDSGTALQDLLEQACRELLAKRGKKVDKSARGQPK